MLYNVEKEFMPYVELLLKGLSKAISKIDYLALQIGCENRDVIVLYDNAGPFDLLEASNHLQVEGHRRFMEVNYPTVFNDDTIDKDGEQREDI